ncbi:MAG: DUF362 domain-containing protein [Patescibacteria group bacterium]|jgi:uncharacterized protein (DUF362 family)
MISRVSLVKSNDHFEGTKSALENLRPEIEAKVKRSKEVVLKINFVSVLRELATTPSEAVDATIDFLRSFYDGPIKIVETATMGTTAIGFLRYGFNKLAKKYQNVQILDLAKDQTVEMDLGGFTVPYSKTMKETDCLISITRPKTHNSVVATLALKNVAVGGIVGARGQIHSGDINKNLLASAKFRAPDISILDGVVGMQGNGPISGDPIDSGWVSVSTDFMAIDTLALFLMGINLDDVGYLTYCAQDGMGNIYPKDVEVLGEDPASLKKAFKMHPTFGSQRLWR